MVSQPDDKATIGERVGLAEQSSDLTLRLRSGCDADKLLAVGMAAQRRPLALALHRLIFAQDHSAYVECRTLLRHHVLSTAIRDAWIVKWKRVEAAPQPADLRKFADAVLTWRVNDACPECTGRKYMLLDSTVPDGPRVLAPRLCPKCHGTGKRPFRWRNPWWEEKGVEIAAELDDMIDRLVSGVRRKLGR